MATLEEILKVDSMSQLSGPKESKTVAPLRPFFMLVLYLGS